MSNDPKDPNGNEFMDNEDDDFIASNDFSEGNDEDGFYDLQKPNTLADLWRNNPLVKGVAVIVVLVVVIFGITMFGGNSEPETMSQLSRASDVTEAPGTGELSENFQAAVEEFNEENVEEALRTQGSALPVPITPQRGQLPVEDVQQQEDPLERWRRLRQERIEQEQQEQIVNIEPEPEAPSPQPVPQQAPVDTGRQETVTALSQSMATQMSTVLETRGIDGIDVVSMTTPEFLIALSEQNGEGFQSGGGGSGGNFTTTNFDSGFDETGQALLEEPEILLPAAEIEYAQMITEANTDAPGPVLAQVMSGPLQGSRLLGTFQQTEKFLVINFNTIVIDEQSQPISAVAVDPNTSLTGVVTEIDNRYFQRVILPAAAAFVEGFSEAVAQAGSTNVTVEGDVVTQETEDLDVEEELFAGLEDAGQEVGDLLDDIGADVRPMIRVAAGTPLGILFLEPVVEEQ